MQRSNTLLAVTLALLTACVQDAETTEPTASTGQVEGTGSSTSPDGSTSGAPSSTSSEEGSTSGAHTSDAEGSTAETGTDASSSTGAAPSAPDIAGRWVSPCFDQGDGTFARLDFDLTAEAWTLDYRVNGNDTCEFPLVTVHIAGPYTLEDPSVVEGAWNGVFAFNEKTITPHAQPLVEALDGAGCGSEAWAVDETQSVAGGCAAFGQYPLVTCGADYDIVARDGDTLRFGQRPADNDMCSPENRPTELAPLTMRLR